MTPRRATVYIGLIVFAGTVILNHGLWNWSTQDWPRYLSYCAIALLASGMKVTLPSVSGTMSMNFLFVLIGISELSLAETLAIGCLGILVQSVFQSKHRLRRCNSIFNVASMACSIEISYDIYHASFFEGGTLEAPIRLLLAAATFFVTNTLSIATVIALTERKIPGKCGANHISGRSPTTWSAPPSPGSSTPPASCSAGRRRSCCCRFSTSSIARTACM